MSTKHTSCSSCTRSSMVSRGVLIRQCCRLTRHSSTASSRSLRLWTLSSRLSSAMAKAKQRGQVHGFGDVPVQQGECLSPKNEPVAYGGSPSIDGKLWIDCITLLYITCGTANRTIPSLRVGYAAPIVL